MARETIEFEVVSNISEQAEQLNGFKEKFKGAMDSFKTSMANFKTQMDEAGGGIKGFGKALKDNLSGLKNFEGGFKMLNKAFIGSAIGIVVVALAALAKALMNNMAFMEKFNVAMTVVNVAFDKLGKYLMDVGGSLGNVFKNPMESLKSFGKAIVDNILNRFKAFGVYLEAIKKALDGDFKGAAKTAADASIQLGTGITDATDKIKAASKAVKETVTEVSGLAMAFIATKKALDEFNQTAEANISKLEAQAEAERTIADDATKSFKVRQEAAKKAADFDTQAFNIKQRQLELEIAAQEAAVAKEVEGSISKYEAQKELNDKEAALFVLRKERNKQITENEKQQTEITSDEAEQRLDYLIDGFDGVSKAFEKQIAKEGISYKKRKDLLDNYRVAAQTNYEDQVALMEEFSGKTIDMNELIMTSDAKALGDKVQNLGLSEVMANRLLEMIKERRDKMLDLNDQETEINKNHREELNKNAEAYESYADRIEDTKLRQIEDPVERAIEQEKLKQERLREEILANEELTEQQKQDLILQFENATQEKIQEIKGKAAKAEVRQTTKQAKEQQNANLEGAKTTLNTIGTMADEDTVAAKGAAVANATINTYEGASKALAQGGIWGPIAAAAVIAAGTAQVASIAGIEPPKRKKYAFGGFINGASHANGGVGIEAEGGEFIVNKRAMANPSIANAVQSFNQAGNTGSNVGGMISEERVAEIASQVVGSIPVQVSEQEITSTQRAVKVREEATSF